MERLVTDWGTIPVPDDMKGLCRIRKDGWPDTRYKGAFRWYQRFCEEALKLKTAHLNGT